MVSKKDDEIVVAEIEPEPKSPNRVNGRPSKKSLADAQRQLDDDQMRLAVWLSIPEKARKPATKKELAKTLRVSEMTLHRWCKDPNVVMAARWLTLNSAGDVGRVTDILDFYYETAMNADEYTGRRLEAARDWMKAVGVYEAWKYDNKLLKVKDIDDFDLDELSDDQLWDLYNTRSKALGRGPEFTDSLMPEADSEEAEGSDGG